MSDYEEIMRTYIELNTSNYDHDDVCRLNAWGIEAVSFITDLTAELSTLRDKLATAEADREIDAGNYKALREQNERMRKALEHIADYVYNMGEIDTEHYARVALSSSAKAGKDGEA